MKTVGIIVLVLGITMASFTGFTFVTKKKVVDLGPLEVSKEEKHPIFWSPVTGGVLILAGIIILIVDNKRS